LTRPDRTLRIGIIHELLDPIRTVNHNGHFAAGITRQIAG
jgi:hypothetical protein